MHDVSDRPTDRPTSCMSNELIMRMRELQGRDVMHYHTSTFNNMQQMSPDWVDARLGGRQLLLLQTAFHTGGPECQEAAQHSEHCHGRASSMLSY